MHRSIFWRLSCMPQQCTTSRLSAYHVSPQHSIRLHWTLEGHRGNRARMIRWERAGFYGHCQHGYKSEARTKAIVCISVIRPWGHGYFYFLWAFVMNILSWPAVALAIGLALALLRTYLVICHVTIQQLFTTP